MPYVSLALGLALVGADPDQSDERHREASSFIKRLVSREVSERKQEAAEDERQNERSNRRRRSAGCLCSRSSNG
jgi:hypothetical protein